MEKRSKGFPSEFRHQFGLSQLDLANYLDIGQPLIAMSEANQQTIESKAVLKEIRKLSVLFDTETPPEKLEFVHDLVAEEREQSRSNFEEKLTELEELQRLKETELETLCSERTFILRRLQALRKAFALDSLKEAPTDAALKEFWAGGYINEENKKRFLEGQIRTNLRKLGTISIFMMYEKEAEIAGIKEKIAFLKRTLKG